MTTRHRRFRIRNLSATVAVALSAALLAAGCGEKEESLDGPQAEELKLMLDFFVNPDHAGIYTGIERGDFAEAGLDLKPMTPSDPAAPIKLVASGEVDLAISYEPEVAIARDRGLDVVAVASLVNEPLTSLISLPKAGIKDVRDLAGKTVATAGIPYQQAFLDAILARVGLEPDDVKTVEVGLNLLPAVLSGRADAMLGGFRNVEGVDLRERGEKPRVVPVDQLGIPTYDELVLVASGDRVREDPEAIRLFIAALEQGTRAAIDDPQAATRAILGAGDGLDPKLTRAEIDATLPFLAPANPEARFGEMDGSEWAEFAGFLADQGVVELRYKPEELFTNELLGSNIPE